MHKRAMDTAQINTILDKRRQEADLDVVDASREPVALIIEDEAECRALCERVLSTVGFAIHCAPDGPSGLKLWRQERPHLILLDIMMPGPNGFQTLEQARKEGMGGRVIITSALLKKKLIERAAALGVASYIAKPFSLKKLVDAAKAALPELILTDTLQFGTQPDEECNCPPPPAKEFPPFDLPDFASMHPSDVIQSIVNIIDTCASNELLLPDDLLTYIGACKSGQLVKMLEDKACDEKAFVRKIVASTLCNNVVKFSQRTAVNLLSDNDPEVLATALSAASRIEDERIQDLIFSKLMHADAAVRQAAFEAIDTQFYRPPVRILMRVLISRSDDGMLSMNAMRFLQKMSRNRGLFQETLENFPIQQQNIRKYIEQLISYLEQDEDDTELVMTLLDERHLQTQRLGVKKVLKDIQKSFKLLYPHETYAS